MPQVGDCHVRFLFLLLSFSLLLSSVSLSSSSLSASLVSSSLVGCREATRLFFLALCLSLSFALSLSLGLSSSVPQERKDIKLPPNAPSTFFHEKHVEYIVGWNSDKSAYEYTMAEYLRVSGLYWFVPVSVCVRVCVLSTGLR